MAGVAAGVVPGRCAGTALGELSSGPVRGASGSLRPSASADIGRSFRLCGGTGCALEPAVLWNLLCSGTCPALEPALLWNLPCSGTCPALEPALLWNLLLCVYDERCHERRRRGHGPDNRPRPRRRAYWCVLTEPGSLARAVLLPDPLVEVAQ